VWFGKKAKPGDNARKVMTARADAHAAKLAPTIKKAKRERRDEVAGHRRGAEQTQHSDREPAR
jgi:hypothetical protein